MGKGDVESGQTPQLHTEYGVAGSAESVKSELSIFDGTTYQVTHIKGHWVELFPQNQYQGTSGCSIIFKISGSTGWYLDLSDTYMILTMGIKSSTGGDLPAAEFVSWENCAFTTIFRDVAFSGKSQTKIEGENQMYHYRAYLYNLINGNRSAKKNQMRCIGWEKDTPEHYDKYVAAMTNNKYVGNEAYHHRQKWTTGNTNLQLAGFVHLDTWLQKQYFLDGEDFDLVFKLNDPALVLHTEATNSNTYKINIVQCSLHVRQVQVAPNVLLGHSKGLQSQNAVYPYVGHKVFSTLIKPGGSEFRAEDLFRGTYPNGIIIGLVDHDAFCGKYHKNPFNFQHFDVSEIKVLVNGYSIPQKPYTPNFTTKEVMREYFNLYLQLGGSGILKDDMGIDLKDFCGGCALYVFNLSPDLSFGGHGQMQKLSNVNVELRFRTAPTIPIQLVALCLYDTSVEMTGDRRWLLDPTQAAN